MVQRRAAWYVLNWYNRPCHGFRCHLDEYFFLGLSYRQMCRKFKKVVVGLLAHVMPSHFFSRILTSEAFVLQLIYLKPLGQVSCHVNNQAFEVPFTFTDYYEFPYFPRTIILLSGTFCQTRQ